MLAQQRTWPVGFSPRQRPGPLPCRVAGPGPLSSPCRRLALVLFGIVVLGKGVNSAKRSIRQRGVWQRGQFGKEVFGKEVFGKRVDLARESVSKRVDLARESVSKRVV